MSRPVALFRNEMLKTFKRLATWVTLGLFSFIVFMNFGDEYLGARKDPERTFALPDAWPKIFGDGAFVGLVFGTVLLILMVAGEFSWRTARQNVVELANGALDIEERKQGGRKEPVLVGEAPVLVDPTIERA